MNALPGIIIGSVAAGILVIMALTWAILELLLSYEIFDYQSYFFPAAVLRRETKSAFNRGNYKRVATIARIMKTEGNSSTMVENAIDKGQWEVVEAAANAALQAAKEPPRTRSFSTGNLPHNNPSARKQRSRKNKHRA